MKKPRIFLTGATGLVGSHVLLELVKKRESVMVLVRNVNVAQQKLSKVFEWYGLTLSEFADIIFYKEGEITDVDLISESLTEIDTVYHCAGMISLFDSDKWEMLKVNGEGTANIVNCCLSMSVKHLLYISSINTINKGNNKQITEDLFLKENGFLSAYAISKRVGENEVWRGIEEGLQAVIVNPSVIIGPTENKNGSIGLLYKVKEGMKYFTNGVTGYVDVRDVSAICIELIDKKIFGQRFIVSSENLSFESFLYKIKHQLKLKEKLKLAPAYLLKLVAVVNGWRSFITGKNYLPNKAALKMVGNTCYYSNDKVKKILSYEFYSVDEAIQNTIAKMNWNN